MPTTHPVVSTPKISSVIPVSPNPQSLHHEFVRLGSLRLKLKNKMLAILPEIYKSGIWKKYAGKIEEYAGKFGDIADTTTRKRLRLDENTTFLFLKLKKKFGKNLSDKEFLKLIIEEREKREFPILNSRQAQKEDKITGKIVLQKSACRDSHEKDAVHILTDQKSVISAKAGSPTGDTSRENLPQILDKKILIKSPAGETSTSNKTISVKTLPNDGEASPVNTFEASQVASSENQLAIARPLTVSRYIPATKKRQVLQPTNGRCSYPNCNSPYAILHHRNRYSESKKHDSIIPLCKVHHEFAHNNLIKAEKLSANQWKLTIDAKKNIKISRADFLYREYRQKATN